MNKCEYCNNIRDYKKYKSGSQTEDIFYDGATDKYILILEQFRYEHAMTYIEFCPKCGRKLDVHRNAFNLNDKVIVINQSSILCGQVGIVSIVDTVSLHNKTRYLVDFFSDKLVFDEDDIKLANGG